MRPVFSQRNLVAAARLDLAQLDVLQCTLKNLI
jgi:hypothetical protein